MSNKILAPKKGEVGFRKYFHSIMRKWLKIWRSSACRWSLLVLLSYSLALHVWGLSPWGKTIDFNKAGTLGQWVSGIGTLAAVLVALYAINDERHRFIAEEMKERDLSASRVYAWIAPSYDEMGNPKSWEVHFNNDTPTPIYYWVLRLQNISSLHFCHITSGPLLPGKAKRWLDPNQIPISPDPVSTPRTLIAFVDEYSRVWRRNYDGLCEPVMDSAIDPRSHKCQ